METPPRPTPTICMDSLENPRTPLAAECSKASGTGPNIQQGLTLPLDAPSSSQDIGGMMKIVPSELDVSSSPCIIIQQDVQNEIYLSMIMFLIFKFMLFFFAPAQLHVMLQSHLVLLRLIWKIVLSLLCFSISS